MTGWEDGKEKSSDQTVETFMRIFTFLISDVNFPILLPATP